MERKKDIYLEKLYKQKGEKFMPEECDLYLGFNPLIYEQVTRRMKTYLNIASNCYGQKDIILEVNLKDDNRVNFDWHPTMLNLFLWDNYYKVQF